MALDRITLADFRNHADSRLDGTSQLCLLVGENGAGKTNVLEALSLLSAGRGLRRAALAEMAGGAGAGGFAVSARLYTGGTAEAVRLGTGIQANRPGRRLAQINGAQASAISFGEWLAVGWLTPAMDRLFAESPGSRRRYMDRLAVAIDPAHARHATRFEASLRERNRLLANPARPDPAWLDAVEAQLAACGARLAQGRALLVEALAAELAQVSEEPFARPGLTYVPGGPLEEADLAHQLAASRPRERSAQRTLVGPHRDELEVMMAGKAVGAKAMPAGLCSTGEQKAMLIAITLAHAALAARGRPGLLLLDEVAAHLDPLRRAALFERLRDGDSQVWLTGTEPAPFAQILGEAATWKVARGQVERL